MIRDLLYLIRPYQYVKNVFVILPLFFGQHLMDKTKWVPVLFAFIAFCLASSGVYCLNDICDAESDRLHPSKCKRPMASGKVSATAGYIVMAICWVLSIIFSIMAGKTDITIILATVSIIMIYILLNIAYCVKLKNFSIIDLLIVAAGFLLRLVVGGVVSGIALSHWIIMVTFLCALFIATAKRRDDVVVFEENGLKHRANIARYNSSFMNLLLGIIASVTIVCYIMYTLSDDVMTRMGSKHIYFTGIFVLAGIIRYLQLTIVDHKSGNPIKVVSQDTFLQLCIAGWIVSFFILIYL